MVFYKPSHNPLPIRCGTIGVSQGKLILNVQIFDVEARLPEDLCDISIVKYRGFVAVRAYFFK